MVFTDSFITKITESQSHPPKIQIPSAAHEWLYSDTTRGLV